MKCWWVKIARLNRKLEYWIMGELYKYGIGFMIGILIMLLVNYNKWK